MINNYVKIDENTIAVTRTEVAEPITTNFTYDYLISQRDTIQKSKDNFNKARDVELALVNECLVKCVELKIVPKLIN